MHRYIPVLAKNAGFVKISEKIVKHHPRKHGKTKYGADRFVKGFLDLITLWFIHKFGKRPMHFFGLIGTVMLLVGFFFSIYLGFDKLFIKTSGRLITERPEFFIALATMIMGSQFFLAGFLGEIILRNKKIKKQYKIAEKLINE
jgi:drug/metabolite transporter (DMT)-like permease